MQVWVRFLSGGRRGETVPLMIPPGGSATIGRADDNAIVLPAAVDVAASSHHAEIQNRNNVIYIVDTGSTNGTWVYGNRITEVPLASGVPVTFGRGGPEAEIVIQAPAPPQHHVPVRTMPSAPAAAPHTAPMAAHPAAAPPQAPPVLPRPGDPCGLCGAPLGSDLFLCYQCRLGLCASHYDPEAGKCSTCSGGVSGSTMQMTRPQQVIAPQTFGSTAPSRSVPPAGAFGATAPSRSAVGSGGYAAQDGCEICGAIQAPSFVCYGCTRTVCESHRESTTGMCEQCAGAASGPAASPEPPQASGGKKTMVRGTYTEEPAKPQRRGGRK